MTDDTTKLATRLLEVLENDIIPLTRRGYIRDYFEAIRPEEP